MEHTAMDTSMQAEKPSLNDNQTEKGVPKHGMPGKPIPHHGIPENSILICDRLVEIKPTK